MDFMYELYALTIYIADSSKLPRGSEILVIDNGSSDGTAEYLSDYSDMLKTLNDYSTVIAGDLFASGRRVTVLAPVYHGIAMFFKIYLIQKGFLDGMPGLVTALTKAGGSFFKYAKLLELQRENKN